MFGSKNRILCSDMGYDDNKLDMLDDFDEIRARSNDAFKTLRRIESMISQTFR